jgi:hypothetical protein
MNAEEVLSADNAFWKFKAQELMEQKKSFVVVEWSQNCDEADATSLLWQFGYAIQYRHSDTRRAFLAPDNSN